MDLNHVSLFVRVVDSGGFTAAAAEVNLPKSSVSRSVSRLEDELGVRLLQRTTRKVTLTEAGQSYYDAVKQSVAALEEAGELAREHGSEPRGIVRLTAPPDLSYLPECLAQFYRLYPAVTVEVSISSRYVDLIAEGFDLALRAGKLEDSSLIARRIASTDMALMASTAYLRKRGRPKVFEELAAHDWVLYRGVGGKSTLRLTGPDGERSLEVAGTLCSDDMTFCRRAVEAGAGIALLPVHGASDAIADGLIEQVLSPWGLSGASLSVVMPSSRFIPTRVALLRDHLVDKLGKHLDAVHERCKKSKAASLAR